jgi:ubiquinone/menaquinone biosynthesis C-methylase UbiE
MHLTYGPINYDPDVNQKTSRGTNLPNPEIISANQKVHTQIATKYNQSEPHFRPENQEKVKQRLLDAKKLAPSNKRMLDVGCGTGFLIVR